MEWLDALRIVGECWGMNDVAPSTTSVFLTLGFDGAMILVLFYLPGGSKYCLRSIVRAVRIR